VLCGGELTESMPIRSGKCTFDVPEQLTFGELLRQRS